MLDWDVVSHSGAEKVPVFLGHDALFYAKQSLSERRLLRSRLPSNLRELNGRIKATPRPQSFDGVPSGVRIGAPHGRSTHRLQLHGISDEDDAEAAEGMLAILYTLRRPALRGLRTSDAHQPEQPLPYHGHFVDEDVVNALHGGLKSHKIRWAESAGVRGSTSVGV